MRIPLGSVVIIFRIVVHHLESSSASASFSFNYPQVYRNESTEYKLFDKIIHDPYQWLEDRQTNHEQIAQFIASQNNLTQSYIHSSSSNDSSSSWSLIEDQIKSLHNYTSYDVPFQAGHYLYQSINLNEKHQQAVLYRFPASPSLPSHIDMSKAEVFLDVASEFVAQDVDDPDHDHNPDDNNNGTVSLLFTSFSPNNKYCAYGIQYGGSDWTVIRIRDTRTLRDLSQDILIKIKFTYGVAWHPQSRGFFYPYYDEYNDTTSGSETTFAMKPKLYYHALNTTQLDDVEIFSFPQHPNWVLMTPFIIEQPSSGGERQSSYQIHLLPEFGVETAHWLYATIDYDHQLITTNESIQFRYIINDSAEAEYEVAGIDQECIYVRTNFKAENFRLVCVPLHDMENIDSWYNILPDDNQGKPVDTQVLTSAHLVGDQWLLAVYTTQEGIDALYVVDRKMGTILYHINSPSETLTTIEGISVVDDGGVVYIKYTSFIQPGVIYRLDLNENNNTIHNPMILKLYAKSEVSAWPEDHLDQFVMQRMFYPSLNDNTIMVPIWLVYRRDRDNQHWNDTAPTLLTAYGGYGVYTAPSYDVLGAFWVQYLDGVFALANIRGGGVFGERWHQAGQRLNKQNCLDDLAAAAKFLLDTNFTTRSMLTVYGHSNGGMVVGATANQHPEYFGAVIAHEGVMDMIRFPLFTIGYDWNYEFGDPQHNREDFEYIYKYSPLHNIPNESTLNNTRYPALLALTATHDDRVVPSHSYKFIAQLQHQLGGGGGRVQQSDTPFLLRVDFDSGHEAPKPQHKLVTKKVAVA